MELLPCLLQSLERESVKARGILMCLMQAQKVLVPPMQELSWGQVDLFSIWPNIALSLKKCFSMKQVRNFSFPVFKVWDLGTDLKPNKTENNSSLGKKRQHRKRPLAKRLDVTFSYILCNPIEFVIFDPSLPDGSHQCFSITDRH